MSNTKSEPLFPRISGAPKAAHFASNVRSGFSRFPTEDGLADLIGLVLDLVAEADKARASSQHSLVPEIVEDPALSMSEHPLAVSIIDKLAFVRAHRGDVWSNAPATLIDGKDALDSMITVAILRKGEINA